MLRRWTLAGLLVLGGLLLAFWFGREVGGFEGQARIASLEAQLGELEARIRNADLERARVEQRLAEADRQARARIDSLVARVPQGELGGLVDLLRARLDGGVPAERLRFVVEQARPGRSCREGVDRRRLSPRLPSEVTPLQTAAFLDNRITISATATPAVAADGTPQSWFDPASPVEIRILRIGGNIELVTNTLPFGHSVVADDREYRFNFASGAKNNMLEITLQDCAYP
jgi:hypothetical protein